MTTIKIGNKNVGENESCFIIAEIGINFNGSIELAKKLIDTAVEAKCDAVKFQAFTAENLYPETAGELDWEDNEKKYSYSIYENVKKFELPYSWVPELKKYCDKNGIIFFSSICDENACDIYDNLNVDLFKTTSYAVTHLPLIEHIAKKGKPIIISTGGTGMEEVREAYNTARKYTNKIILLHCVIKYGASLGSVNMNVLESLQEEFPEAIIGFSDHTSEVFDAPVAAIYKGAKVIEKHITLNRTMEGPDHFFALEPEMLKEMNQVIRETERKMESGEQIEVNPIVLGSKEKKMQPNEEYLRKFAFRTIITSSEIKAGEIISNNNIKVLRPGKLKSELEPKEYPKLINGSFKVKRDLEKGYVLKWEDIENENKCYVIAEIASSHCGDINKMKNIIASSVAAGADAVKVQMFNVDHFVSKFHSNYENNKKNQFSQEQWEDVLSYAKQFDVDLWADVFDEASVDLANKYVYGFKLHSTDVSNPFMIKYVAKKGKPVIIAAGGVIFEELKKAVNIFQDKGCKEIIISHGFQSFPTKIEKVNIKRLLKLKKEFPECKLGYHDHTDAELPAAITIPLAAFAYGASVIEKHITDNRAIKGFDYESSLNIDEFKKMVDAIRLFEYGLGNDSFELSDDEIKYREYMKRYIVAKRKIQIGEEIKKEDLAFKRSTKGLSPHEWEKIVGRKAIRNIEVDETIKPMDVDNKVVICLAVRLKSTRLPKKAILEVSGQTAIEQQIDRLRRCKNAELILCTSTLEEDAPLIEIAKKKGIKYFAGSADDVMDRFMQAAEKEGANIVVRATGDNPFMDPELVDKQIEMHLKEGADYTGIENVPIGLEAEVVYMSTLKDARTRVRDPKDTEYMTWFIKDPKHFKVQVLKGTEDIDRNYRLTLDTPEDLKVVRVVYDQLYDLNKKFTIKDVVNFLDQNQQIVTINTDYKQIKRPPKLEDMKIDKKMDKIDKKDKVEVL